MLYRALKKGTKSGPSSKFLGPANKDFNIIKDPALRKVIKVIKLRSEETTEFLRKNGRYVNSYSFIIAGTAPLAIEDTVIVVEVSGDSTKGSSIIEPALPDL